jgi:hypothetical protein
VAGFDQCFPRRVSISGKLFSIFGKGQSFPITICICPFKRDIMSPCALLDSARGLRFSTATCFALKSSSIRNDWVFYDARFNLLRDSDDVRFLCETIHPIVRPSVEDARELANAYNEELAADGWQIVEAKQISGKPIFAAQKAGSRIEIFEEPTGWQKVDRQRQEMRQRLDTAHSEEQYQAVGLLCREVMISVAQEVYDPHRHRAADGVSPSKTDAKRMLEAIFGEDLKGSSNDEARAHAKAAVNLALALQHKRTADFRTAALCAEGTLSVVNMLAILAGRRGRSLE